jgi:hypothetical protein
MRTNAIDGRGKKDINTIQSAAFCLERIERSLSRRLLLLELRLLISSDAFAPQVGTGSVASFATLAAANF